MWTTKDNTLTNILGPLVDGGFFFFFLNENFFAYKPSLLSPITHLCQMLFHKAFFPSV